MKESAFIAYVGPPEIHDSSILRLEQKDNQLSVFVRDYDGSVWEFVFSAVTASANNNAEDMVLYALAEFEAAAPLRRFVFVNWDDDSIASLEIVAKDFQYVKAIDTSQ